MDAYKQLIIEDTLCSHVDAEMIEDIMRNEVFHSTLDWQTREQFRQGARKAAKILEQNRHMFQGFRAQALAFFDQTTQPQK